jgi:hypothetical protein
VSDELEHEDVEIADKLVNSRWDAPNSYPIGFKHSPTLGKLTEALAKAAAEFQPIKKETQNPYFKSTYADLATLIEGTRVALSKNGLVVVQVPRTLMVSGSVVVTTALLHTSNEWISDDLELRPKTFDPQGCGSAMTYARRYAYQSILNIAGEPDDDGNAASGKNGKEDRTERAENAFNERTGQDRCSPALVLAFEKMFATSGKTRAELAIRLQTRYSASEPAQLTSVEIGELVKWAASKEQGQETAREPQEAISRPRTAQSTPESSEGSKTPSGHNWRRLYASVRDRKITEEEIKSFYQKRYKVKSGTQLTAEQFADLEAQIAAWRGPEIEP